MLFDKLKYPEELWEERRKAVQESLEPISVEQLRKVAKAHEGEFVDDPWRDQFLRLIEEQAQASFYSAVPQQDVVVYYCREAEFGVWILIGSGMGPLDANGERLMKEAIANRLSGRKIGEKR